MAMDDSPKLHRGMKLQFKNKISFGEFKENAFVCYDAGRLLFRRGLDGAGSIVKILSPYFSLEEWSVVDDGHDVSTSDPTPELAPAPVPFEPEQLSLF